MNPSAGTPASRGDAETLLRRSASRDATTREAPRVSSPPKETQSKLRSTTPSQRQSAVAQEPIAPNLALDSPADPDPKASTGSLPVGKKAVGKPGFVHSPFGDDKRLVDVSGIPAGTKVKCPYTMKIFLVP